MLGDNDPEREVDMRAKELLVEALLRPELLRLGRALGLDVVSRDRIREIRETIARRSEESILDELRAVDLRTILNFWGFPSELIPGSAKSDLRSAVEDLIGDASYRAAAEASLEDDGAWDAVRDRLGLSVEEDDDEDDDEDAGDEDADDDEPDEADEADDEGPLSDDVFDFDEVASRTEARDYQAELIAALAKAVQVAAPGKRLRITVGTGGGKTRIANDWILEHARREKLKVLWVTKDWALLRQASSDLCRRRHGAAQRLGYVGTKGARLLGALSERANADVVYTTVHTWRSRKDDDFARARFDAVIIDESHWGEGKRAYRDLYNRYRDRAVFIGLTATPREGTGFTLVGEAYGYTRLADLGWLARPIHDPPVNTGFEWSPGRSTSHGDFDRPSLAKLARCDKRNRLIVESFVRGREKYGKTLVFACDIEHACKLASSLKNHGVSATELHHRMTAEEQQSAIRRFSEGSTRVLVNVAMMTHGIDIPDIETVFLARPTLSKTLFAQMVGRAVRKTETKTHFRLVDFVDNLTTHPDILISPRTYFDVLDGASRTSGSYRPAPRSAVHSYVEARFEHVPTVNGYEEIVGFDLQPSQTFGIEFELTREGFTDGERPRDWMKVATTLLEAIPAPRAPRAHADYHSEEKNHSVWNVEYDGSCGWEVTSRVLSGSPGFFEVAEVCRGLDRAAADLGLKLTTRTGTHIHLSWVPRLESLRRLMRLVAHFEPALYTLVAPSRSENPYCEPIRKHLSRLVAMPSLREWQAHFEDHSARYLSVNPANLFGDGLGTVEVRLHSGTIEGPKILGWLSLWMRLLDAAQGPKALPEGATSMQGLPLAKGPQGDVMALADYVLAHGELSRHLRRRRGVVLEQWLKHPEHGQRAREVAAAWT